MSAPVATRSSRVEQSAFGRLPDGRDVERYVVREGGLELEVLSYGAIIRALRTPDRHGTMDDVVLGFDTLADYVVYSPYFGALVGRCANRIAFGRFTLDGVQHQLSTNDGLHHLHGGVRGFDRMMWSAAAFETPDSAGVSLTRTSVAGEEGYPGALEARVDYSVLSSGALRIDYSATTMAPTIVNLTQHTYFDLSAGLAADIGGHELTIRADDFTPVNEQLIPTGQLQRVDGTPFDFRRSTAVSARIAEGHEQLAAANGYDHNFVLARRADVDTMTHAAHVREPISGRMMDIHTTEPGLQFYSGNFLDGSISGKRGRIYPHRGGLSLETQHYPDSPNHQDFPSIVLRPGATYHSSTIYAFSV